MTYLLGALLLCGMAAAVAAPAARPGNAPATVAAKRVLPELALEDSNGRSAGTASLRRPVPWVLLVVDANRPQTQSTLARLEQQEGWGDGVNIIALGSDAAFQAMVQRHSRLRGVQWFRDSGGAMKALRLPGLPAALGVDGEGVVAWQSLGLPANGGKAQSLLSTWINGNKR
ncbi:hypothetical protein [Pseudoduganella violacea]|uniref:Uncharacterized protein n=1 Tax=Pseudoduganella violacea TaxID=1715466 RepID=A0A7W5FX13_9BURK|nr:hypothetical protein [Pseudoduganella violacea]MBB3122421.1 hypothetical protein [Pseudoduganella violacea]